MDVKNPDLMSWLLEESDKSEDKEENLNWLLGDAHLIIVAGRSVYSSHLFIAFNPSHRF
jgi:hypothetical protein